MTMEGLYPQEKDYLDLIADFPKYAERGWHGQFSGNAELGYFADGGSGENGIRTNANFVFTAAFLANETAQAAMFTKACNAINYLLQAHLTGSGQCADGKKWGAHWQSAWWTNKLVFGAKLIWDRLNDAQREGINTVLVFEANRHLERMVPSGTFLDTKAEENAWDAEILATAYNHLPTHENAQRWLAKAREFNLNTLSVAHDTRDSSVVDGLVVKDHVYTCNLHSDFTIENHGASHFCYIASPLLSITWSFYSYLQAGNEPPQALFHHVHDFWQLSKCTFLDSRFAYIGGKDWARYTYGLYFIVPALVMLQSKFQDTDARYIEQQRVRTLAAEHADNHDGSFYGKRVTKNIFRAQPAKYETDCYAMCVLSYLLHKALALPKAASPPEDFRATNTRYHASPESGTHFVSNPSFFSSFSWNTLTGNFPIALFIPRGCDDMAEWSANNLVGIVKPVVDSHGIGIHSSKASTTDETLRIQGASATRSANDYLFDHFLDIAMSSSQVQIATCIKAKTDFYALRSGSIAFALVNDWFNDFQRTIYHQNGQETLHFNPDEPLPFAKLFPGKLKKVHKKICSLFHLGAKRRILHSHWLNIDNKLGLIRLGSTESYFYIDDPVGRNTNNQCLHYATIYGGQPRLRPHKIRRGSIVFDEKILLIPGTAEQTRQLAATALD